jgi:hypothetical protein
MMSTASSTNDATFAGLAFVTATVTYSNGHYNATIVRDVDRKYRARVSYDHAINAGARNAIRAARAAFEKALADNDGLSMDGDYVAIPGDLDNSKYVFTFVPTRFFDQDSNS